MFCRPSFIGVIHSNPAGRMIYSDEIKGNFLVGALLNFVSVSIAKDHPCGEKDDSIHFPLCSFVCRVCKCSTGSLLDTQPSQFRVLDMHVMHLWLSSVSSRMGPVLPIIPSFCSVERASLALTSLDARVARDWLDSGIPGLIIRSWWSRVNSP